MPSPRSGGTFKQHELVPSTKLVMIADCVLLVLIILVVIWRLPRAITRFRHASAWTRGHFLLQGQPMANPNAALTESKASSSSRISACNEQTEKPTVLPTVSSVEPTDMTEPPLNQGTHYPPHCPSSPRVLRSLALLLQFRFIPGWTIGQTSILLVYLLFLLIASLYKSDPFTDPLREGWLMMAQVPFVFAFSSKNNILGSLLGMGYEKLNFVHRFFARLVVVWANIHTLGYIYEFARAGTFYQEMSKVGSIWGTVVLVGFNIMWLFSTEFWRKRAYRVFLFSHFLAVLVFIPGVWYHTPAQMPYVVLALLIYTLDRACRLIKSRITEAELQPIPELGVTKVIIPKLRSGWTAGQHVRLRVYSSRMGRFGWAEVHPFTISSASDSQESLVLMCRKAGSWTNKLYEAAESSGPEQPFTRVKVHVHGPYGGTGHTVIPSFSGAMIVGGGSGITFGLSTVQDLLLKDRGGESRVKHIKLVWTVQDPSSLNALLPMFVAMLDSAQAVSLNIIVHYTRPRLDRMDDKPLDISCLPPGLTLARGRPKLSELLKETVSETISTKGGPKDADGLKGVFLGVCGPVGLADECAKALGTIDPIQRDEVGGVELHEEVFGW